MRFAVCDDNAADRRQLLSMLQQYCGNHRVQAEIQPFADGRALLQAFAPGKFQILFLDIYMPALTGMELPRLSGRRIQGANWCLPPPARTMPWKAMGSMRRATCSSPIPGPAGRDRGLVPG